MGVGWIRATGETRLNFVSRCRCELRRCGMCDQTWVGVIGLDVVCDEAAAFCVGFVDEIAEHASGKCVPVCTLIMPMYCCEDNMKFALLQDTSWAEMASTKMDGHQNDNSPRIVCSELHGWRPDDQRWAATYLQAFTYLRINSRMTESPTTFWPKPCLAILVLVRY